MTSNPIIFFDGVCGLCNRVVDIVMFADKKKFFLYSPLQGETAERELDPPYLKDLDTIVLRMPDGKIHKKSSAVLRIAARLSGVWPLLGIFIVLPPFIRDLVYDLVAKNRYRIFGKRESCRTPTSKERERFLP